MNLEKILKKAMPVLMTGIIGISGCELFNKKQDIGNIGFYSQSSQQSGISASSYSAADSAIDCDMCFKQIEISDGKTWTTILDKEEMAKVSAQSSQIGASKSVAIGEYHAIRITLKPEVYVRTIYHGSLPAPTENVEINQQYNGFPTEVYYPNGTKSTGTTGVILLSSADKNLTPFNIENGFDLYTLFKIRNRFAYDRNDDNNNTLNNWEELHFDMWTSRMAP